jgi:hypothetical protein
VSLIHSKFADIEAVVARDDLGRPRLEVDDHEVVAPRKGTIAASFSPFGERAMLAYSARLKNVSTGMSAAVFGAWAKADRGEPEDQGGEQAKG